MPSRRDQLEQQGRNAFLSQIGKPAASSTGASVNGSTDKPENPRVVASYKIDADVKREFARFVKALNRDREPNEETEIGQVAEWALQEYMRAHKGDLP